MVLSSIRELFLTSQKWKATIVDIVLDPIIAVVFKLVAG